MNIELFEFLTANGKIVSKRLNRDYFERHNKHHLLAILDSYPPEYSLRVRASLSINEVGSLPKCCVCGAGAIIDVLGGVPKFSNYCSNTCKNKNMSNTMKTIVKGRDEVGAQKKREATLLEKTGYKYNSQRPDVKIILKKSKLPAVVESRLLDRDWLHDQVHEQNLPSTAIADKLGCDYTTVLAYMDMHSIGRNKTFKRSSQEIKLEEYIRTLGETIEVCNTAVLHPKEIDILVPGKRIGFEIDGLRYHCRDVHYHANKTQQARSAGIALYHFTDKQINEQFPIVCSMIRCKLGHATKIPARKCEIREVPKEEARRFFETTHISGHSNAGVYIGLYYKGMLVSAMSFSKPRFSEDADWELIRFSSALGHVVVGGGGRILKFFRKYNSGSILSYCNLMHGTGAGYDKMGFDCVRTTAPGYFWTDGNKVLSRYQTQKSRLPNLLGSKYTPGTENDTMSAAGYKKFWDCGNSVWLLK